MGGPADHCHVPRFILGAEVQAVDSWNRSQKLINIWSSACRDSATEQSPAFAWASWSSRPRRGPGRHPPRTTPWGAFLSPQAHPGFTDRWPLSSRPTPHDRQGPPPMPRAEPVTAQHSTAQHSTAQHSTAQHSTAQHSTAQHSTAQHSTAQHTPPDTVNLLRDATFAASGRSLASLVFDASYYKT